MADQFDVTGSALPDESHGRTRGALRHLASTDDVFDEVANEGHLGARFLVTYDGDIVDTISLEVASQWIETADGHRWFVSVTHENDLAGLWARGPSQDWLPNEQWTELGVPSALFEAQADADLAAYRLAMADLRPWLDWYRDSSRMDGDELVHHVAEVVASGRVGTDL